MYHSLVNSLVYIVKIIPFVLIGVFIAELLTHLNLTGRLSRFTRPVTDFSNLYAGCGLAFVSAFASPMAANSMLFGFYKNKEITEKELIIAVLVNSFPISLMHWRVTLPVILPVLHATGMVYFFINVAIGFLKTGTFLIIGRMILNRPSKHQDGYASGEKVEFKEALGPCLKKSMKLSYGILQIMVPVTILLFLLMDSGFVTKLSAYFEVIPRYFPLPSRGVPIIAAQSVNNIAAYTIAGNLLHEKLITPESIILSLLTGSILGVIQKLRFLIPSHIGIYGKKLGTKILLISIGSNIVFIIAAILFLSTLWKVK
jgi:hypothetical protein